MEGARYLEDGKLTVFRRAGIYYARLRLAGSRKYTTRSLNTSNEQTAVDLGRRLLFQIEQRSEQGLPPKSKLFGAVIDDYIRHRERDHRHGGTSAGMLRQIVRVSKFWREYAGRLAVETIDDKVMREFIPWRRDYYANFDKLPKNAKRHPTDKTLQWDMMLGKAIVKWAAEQGLRGKQPPITVTFTPKKKRVRPAFERWNALLYREVELSIEPPGNCPPVRFPGKAASEHTPLGGFVFERIVFTETSQHCTGAPDRPDLWETDLSCSGGNDVEERVVDISVRSRSSAG